MNFNHSRNIRIVLIIIALCCCNIITGQGFNNGKINGIIKTDSTWTSKVYLSYLPTYSDIYSISSEMIIAESNIDSLGYFEFKIDFLPKEQKLYRLHLAKKSDSKSSLIIGGSNENYLLFIANKNSVISLKTKSSSPIFRNVDFNDSKVNSDFQKITDLVHKSDSIASESEAYKRKFIEDNLNQELLKIADSSKNPMISLYAIYKSDFESNHLANEKFYKSFLKEWTKLDNAYINDLRKKLPFKEPKKNVLFDLLLYFMLIIVGYLIGKYVSLKKQRIEKLSVQERKILELLRNGASNKEISEEFNIGISTVKSHVSSILNKLNVKSRKEIMNL